MICTKDMHIRIRYYAFSTETLPVTHV